MKSDNILEMFIAEAKRHPILSREEERKIAKRFVRTGLRSDRDKLINSNLLLVVKQAHTFSGKFGMSVKDFIQEGVIGMMHALRNYKPIRNVRFASYAKMYVISYMQEHVRKHGSVMTIPQTVHRRVIFGRAERSTPDEMTALSALRFTDKAFIVTDEGSRPHPDLVSKEDPLSTLTRKDIDSHVRRALDELRPNLTERQIQILDERILAPEPRILQAFADETGVSRQAIAASEGVLRKRVTKCIREYFQSRAMSAQVG